MPDTDAARDFVKLLETNSTDTAFTAPAATATEPTGDDVIDLSLGSLVPRWVKFVFFGAGTENTTFSARLIGWKKVGTLWVPYLRTEVACTLSAAVGVSGQPVTNTDRFVDTMTLTTGSATDNIVVSPAGDVIAHLLANTRGCAKLQVKFDMTGATSGNALYAVM
jgi:hypothetical protein